ncbi:hypothetical protein D3C79_1062540 [compost metagenome]
MEHRKHDLDGRFLQLRILAHGNTATVVNDGNAVVGMDRDLNPCAITGQCFVNAIVNDFPD